MAVKTWETIKVCYCGRVGQDVGLEAEMVYPAENLPDQPARVLAHRCSNGVECNTLEKTSCVWSGTNPAYDPFSD
jgi:hypothetical protein